MDDSSHGVKATIIDFGLARMKGGGAESRPQFTPMEDSIFEGEGKGMEELRESIY